MQKNTSHQLPSRSKYFLHQLRNIIFGWFIIAIALYFGMLGYHHFEHMSWIDSFVNAAMILSGMGPMGALATDAGKIFAGCYALFSGLAFIAIIGLVFAPTLHRFFRKIHIESSRD